MAVDLTEKFSAYIKQLETENIVLKADLKTTQLKCQDLQTKLTTKSNILDIIRNEIPSIIARFDKNLRYIELNPAFTLYSGISHETCIGKTHPEVGFPEDFCKLWDKKISEVFITGKAFTFEAEYLHPNGTNYFYTGQGFPEFDNDGCVQSVLCIAHNITDSKMVEITYKEYYQQIQALVENAPDIIARIDPNLKYIYLNPAQDKYTGIPHQHFLGKTFYEAGIPECYCKIWEEKLREFFSIGKNMIFEYFFCNSSEKKYYFDVHIVPEYHTDGTIKNALCISRDITHLKLMEDTIKQRQQEFEQLVENSPDIITRFDNNYYCLYANNAIHSVTGLSPQAYLNQKAHDFPNIDENFKILAISNIQKVFSTSKDVAFESEYYGLNRKYYFHVRYVPEFSPDGSIKSVLCIHHDITIHKQMTNELSRLDRLNMVGEMAASIGHEVRNPMTTVRGFLQIMKQKNLEIKYLDFFDIMIDELDRANSIISEFLSLAKNKSLNLEERNLNKIIMALVPLIKADAITNNNEILVNLADIPTLLLDEKEIRQLILNLVRNAIEAMPSSGTITIKTFMEDEIVVLAIKDEGTGISPEVINKLGTPFVTTKDNGTGLGLAVCYNIINRHNATITPETSNHGTTFFVKFKPIMHT